MKSKMFLFFIAVFAAAVISCSDDKEVKKKGDPDISHTGEKWNIVSINTYVLSDVGTGGVTQKTGSLSNVGTFYFDGLTKGSFEMTIEGYNKEDRFNYTKDESNQIDIFSVDQSVGTASQNVLVISGEQTSETEMMLNAVSIVKTSAAGVFSLTAATITLEKE